MINWGKVSLPRKHEIPLGTRAFTHGILSSFTSGQSLNCWLFYKGRAATARSNAIIKNRIIRLSGGYNSKINSYFCQPQHSTKPSDHNWAVEDTVQVYSPP
ncbi:mCG4639 [Mus musculus]|nr:mCG4639 [Mus musculus]